MNEPETGFLLGLSWTVDLNGRNLTRYKKIILSCWRHHGQYFTELSQSARWLQEVDNMRLVSWRGRPSTERFSNLPGVHQLGGAGLRVGSRTGAWLGCRRWEGGREVTFMPSQMLGTPWCSHSMSPKPQDTGKDVDVGCWRIRGG